MYTRYVNQAKALLLAVVAEWTIDANWSVELLYTKRINERPKYIERGRTNEKEAKIFEFDSFFSSDLE